jgi:hypothetical protein
MTTEYQLAGPPLEAFLPAIVGVAVLVLALLVSRAARTRGPPSAWIHHGRTAAIVVGGLAVLFGGAGSARHLLAYGRLERAIAANNVEIVTGCLSGFAPARTGWSESDVIVMGQRIIRYGGRVSGPGFRQIEAAGGPIHADSQVRIVLVGDTIVRLDVDQHACPVAPLYRA